MHFTKMTLRSKPCLELNNQQNACIYTLFLNFHYENANKTKKITSVQNFEL